MSLYTQHSIITHLKTNSKLLIATSSRNIVRKMQLIVLRNKKRDAMMWKVKKHLHSLIFMTLNQVHLCMWYTSGHDQFQHVNSELYQKFPCATILVLLDKSCTYSIKKNFYDTYEIVHKYVKTVWWHDDSYWKHRRLRSILK